MPRHTKRQKVKELKRMQKQTGQFLKELERDCQKEEYSAWATYTILAIALIVGLEIQIMVGISYLGRITDSYIMTNMIWSAVLVTLTLISYHSDTKKYLAQSKRLLEDTKNLRDRITQDIKHNTNNS